MRRDWADYSVTEYVLCGLFFASAAVCFLYAGHAWAQDEPFDAMEQAGGGLLLLAGSVDPVRYVLDLLTWLWHRREPAGRDTWITRSAAGLGLLMWAAGLAGNWLAGGP
ncbi:hypothetical protein [Pelomonas cellulosilytica]|uniref:Uncharacterized protein n=1 Tax=Pelomonas cellulosilytica TaxID=2906762 RepID=A0ABS8XTP0_9BURK|nr:hypothetical protein [Pelomonas sp. P8]MCE4554039.1 hypothetical protein [Pelomonas sp. P8]